MGHFGSVTFSVHGNDSSFAEVFSLKKKKSKYPHPSLLHLSYRLSCTLSHFSHVWLFSTPWTVAHQAPLSMGFSRQEYWSGLPCPSQGDLPNLGIEPRSPALAGKSLPLSHLGSLIYISICPYEQMHVKMSIHKEMLVCIDLYKCTYIYKCIHLCMCLYIYVQMVCVCVCIYTYSYYLEKFSLYVLKQYYCISMENTSIKI